MNDPRPRPEAPGPQAPAPAVDDAGGASASSGLFDLRYLIGGLFTLYGVVLVIASPFVDDAKADGLDMNLWLGLGMLALGLGFVGWARWRPLRTEGESALARRDAER